MDLGIEKRKDTSIFRSFTGIVVLCLGSTCFTDLQAQGASGLDNAGNYATWNSGDNQGLGFGPWTIQQVNGGWFLGDPSSRAPNLGGAFVTSGKTFGLWSSADGTLSNRYAKATRSFDPALVTNDRFKISFGFQWDNGDRGFNLWNGTSEIFNFNINGSGMSWTGGGSYAAIPWGGKRENGIQVDLVIIKTATGFRFTITSPHDSSLNGAGSVPAAGVTGFDVYLSAAGGAAGADFNFNNLVLDSVPGDVTPPTIILNGDKLVQVAVGGAYAPPSPEVTVSDETTPTANIQVTVSPLDTSIAGLKTITYTAKDEANNEAAVTRMVLVGDLTATTTDTSYKLQYPATLALNPASSRSVYGQIYVKGATLGGGQTPNIQAWVAVNTSNTDPSTWDASAWRPAAYNDTQTGSNDEYDAVLVGSDYVVGGTYYYATRWQIGSGAYAYGGTSGPWNGTTSVNGVLTIVPVRDVTFAVDMSVQISKGLFNPAVGQGIELKGSFNSWGAGAVMSDLDGDGIYTATIPIQGNSGDSIDYKFRITGGASDGSEWETVSTISGNRSFNLQGTTVQTVKSVTFSNDGTTFAVWSGGATLNPENLAKYAIGGASSLSAQAEGPKVAQGGPLNTQYYTYIEAVVRSDSQLRIVPESTHDLSVGFSSAGNWTTEGAPSVPQTGVPPGCERKRFIKWQLVTPVERTFIRLKSTL